MEPGGATLENHRFACENCGSDMRFAPGTSRLVCDHCGSKSPIPEQRGAIPELDLRRVEHGEVPPGQVEELRLTRCASCGATVEFDAAIHAKECPFCAAPLVADTGTARQIKPQAQLPFLLDEAAAREAMRRWLGRLWFAPSDLTDFARAHRRMEGIYVPYWTYDAETRSTYSGQRGTVYYQTRHVPMTVNGRRQVVPQQVAEVRWSSRSGAVARNFDDVLVLASTSLPKRFTDAIGPWDLSALSTYDPRYLAGFRAEGYGIPVEQAYGEARSIMNGVIEGDVRRDIGGDQQRVGEIRTEVGALTFKHVLLPVWLAAFRYRGRVFRFVVNGRTGSIEGERPWSTVKIALAILIGLAIAVAIAFLQIRG